MNGDEVRLYQARFWKRVSKTDDHWLWIGYVDKSGKARWTYFNGTKQIHIQAVRVAWFLTHGEEAPAQISAKCDQPGCVNPDHFERPPFSGHSGPDYVQGLKPGVAERAAQLAQERRQREIAAAERKAQRQSDAEAKAEARRLQQEQRRLKAEALARQKEEKKAARIANRHEIRAASIEALPGDAVCAMCDQTKPRADMLVFQSGEEWVLRRHCGDCRREYHRTNLQARVQTEQGLLKRVHDSAKKRARDKAMPFDLTLDFLKALWDRQAGKCAVSELPFVINDFSTEWQSHPHNPSLDRIDSKGGYTQDNVRFVLLAVNVALRDWGLNMVLPILKEIVDRAA